MGVSLGAGVAGLDKTVDGVMSIADGSTRVNPLGVVSSLANMPAALIAAQFNLQGPNATTVTACASGVQSIGEGAEMIRRGWADVMLTGGTDAPILRISILGFNAMGALAQRNDATACRPFDATRDGTVLAEGSAVVILEELIHAQQRGAHIYAEVLGHATNLDTNNIVEPDMTGQSAANTMRAAISRSGLQPSEISYIHAHGTATKANDIAESRGIKIVFGEKAPPVSSIKSMTGHTLGAAGSIGVAVSAQAITDWLDSADDELLDARSRLRSRCRAECSAADGGERGVDQCLRVWRAECVYRDCENKPPGGCVTSGWFPGGDGGN